MSIVYKIKDSIFEKYDTVIFDLDNTIWQCFAPNGDTLSAKSMVHPFKLIDEQTLEDISGNICRIDPTVIDVLKCLDNFGMNIGIISKSCRPNTPDEAKPSVMMLKKFDIYKYFSYIVYILSDENANKSEYISNNGHQKILFIDDKDSNLQQVNQSGKADVLDRKKFRYFGDLFSQSKEIEPNTQLQTFQVAPLPITSSRNPWRTLIQKLSFWKHAEDPLTYTDKSDIDEGNPRSKGDMFHQEDHYDIDNQRTYVWGEPWEPMSDIWLDPNVIPTVEDKLKVQHPDKGGIAVSSLTFEAATTLPPEFIQNVQNYISQAFENDEYDEHTLPEHVLDDLWFFSEGNSRIQAILQEHGEELLKIIKDTIESVKTPIVNRRREQYELRKQQAKSSIGDFLLQYFNGESFSLSSLEKMLYQRFSMLNGDEIHEVLQDLVQKRPDDFKLEGDHISIGKAAIQFPVSLDMESLKTVALSPIEDFKKFGQTIQTPDGIYIYIDRGSNVLGIAHLDTVQNLNHFDVTEEHGTKKINNAQLDDRLGAYVLLDLLPKIGVDCDILLTEGEEKGRSTAKYFKPTKDYNWIFSFDRMGMDTVMYQYDDENTKKLIEDHGFLHGKGSFSDIAFLEHLGVKGFNFGVGYYDNHGPQSHAFESHILHNVTRFKDFYNKFKDTKLPHTFVGGRFSSLMFEKVAMNGLSVGDKVFTTEEQRWKLWQESGVKFEATNGIIGKVLDIGHMYPDKIVVKFSKLDVRNVSYQYKLILIPLENWQEYVTKQGNTKQADILDTREPNPVPGEAYYSKKHPGEVCLVLEVDTKNNLRKNFPFVGDVGEGLYVVYAVNGHRVCYSLDAFLSKYERHTTKTADILDSDPPQPEHPWEQNSWVRVISHNNPIYVGRAGRILGYRSFSYRNEQPEISYTVAFPDLLNSDKLDYIHTFDANQLLYLHGPKQSTANLTFDDTFDEQKFKSLCPDATNIKVHDHYVTADIPINDTMSMNGAYTFDGDYIGKEKTAKMFVNKYGITHFEKVKKDHSVVSIGYSPKEEKWYGWSHRATYGFGIGDKVKEGDATAHYVPIGFEAKTLEDAKRMAIGFAESVASIKGGFLKFSDILDFDAPEEIPKSGQIYKENNSSYTIKIVDSGTLGDMIYTRRKQANHGYFGWELDDFVHSDYLNEIVVVYDDMGETDHLIWRFLEEIDVKNPWNNEIATDNTGFLPYFTLYNPKKLSFIDLPAAEDYSDYYNAFDPSPKDPKHQDELEEPWSIRKDLEKQYFETGLHTNDRPEADRPLTPYASLKFGDILDFDDPNKPKPYSEGVAQLDGHYIKWWVEEDNYDIYEDWGTKDHIFHMIDRGVHSGEINTDNENRGWWEEVDSMFGSLKFGDKRFEELSALEHDQWMAWSKDIAKKENISSERLKRWKKLWKPYAELTEEEKNQDREYAEKVIEVIDKKSSLKLADILDSPSPIQAGQYYTHNKQGGTWLVMGVGYRNDLLKHYANAILGYGITQVRHADTDKIIVVYQLIGEKYICWRYAYDDGKESFVNVFTLISNATKRTSSIESEILRSPIDPKKHKPNTILVHTSVGEALELEERLKGIFVPRRETEDDYVYRAN